MLIEVAAQATRDDVRITLPQFDAGIVVKNSVAYRVDKNGASLIVAVGEDADSLRNKTLAHLHSNLVDLNFVHPFDVEQFKPEFIEAMIRYYIAVLMADKRRAHWFRSVFIDRLLLRLSLAGYENCRWYSVKSLSTDFRNR